MKIIAHTMEYRGGSVSSNLAVRNYADEDYEDYKRTYEACFAEMRTALELLPVNCCDSREELLEKANDIFVLEISGKLVGSVAIYGSEIDDFVVAKEFQGKGFGTALLRFAVARMQNAGVEPILLHVADWNRNAVALYLKNGFQITKTETV